MNWQNITDTKGLDELVEKRLHEYGITMNKYELYETTAKKVKADYPELADFLMQAEKRRIELEKKQGHFGQ